MLFHKGSVFFTIDDHCYMGNYWTVLDVKKDKVLIISSDVLWECKYHSDPLEKGLKWGTSDLRGEMEDYYQTHFTALEKTAIMETKTEGVKDYLFALSKGETEKYFAKNDQDAEKTGKPTRTRRHFWWTRTLGRKYQGNQSAYKAGYYSISDNNVSNSKVATSHVYARPAMWIDLKADYFWKLDE